MVRCKNLRIDQKGIAKTRDGTSDLNATAVELPIWHIEIQGGLRYTFAGEQIYEDEESIEDGLTAESWTAIQYNAFNDNAPNIFALNGTDRKRIEASEVHEWGIAAPTVKPILTKGIGVGLTGDYNAKYTYVRKEGTVVIAESNPSPAATNAITLADQSLAVEVAQPTDAQITHIRLYRTLAGGTEYFLVDEIEASTLYAYGYAYDWEEEDAYLDGTGYKFTVENTSETAESGLVALTGVTVLTIGATATYTLGYDGVAYRTDTGGVSTALSGQWRLSGGSAQYEARATLVSGTTPSGILGTWQSLVASRSWSLATNSNCILLVQIRSASTEDVLASANIKLWRETTA